ncbi:hypothetical protein, partial [Saccharicrinis sp. 156]|uniref:hypothetical protein n=1 Tax=Saccharicrinis sp. 156 TaxID=3417574 RepID=UPI003D359AC0
LVSVMPCFIVLAMLMTNLQYIIRVKPANQEQEMVRYLGILVCLVWFNQEYFFSGNFCIHASVFENVI